MNLNTRSRMIYLLISTLCVLLFFPAVSQAEAKKKQQSLKQISNEIAIAQGIPIDEYLMNVYTRLMRYQTAAQDYYNYSTNTPTSPEQYLEIGVKNMSFGGNKSLRAEVNAVINQKFNRTLYISRGELCHDADVCHIMVEAGWSPASGKKDKSLDPDINNVVEYTTYDVAIKFQENESLYKAIVLYYQNADGTVTALIVDPGIPLINTIVSDILPAVKSPWNDYIYSGLYWQIVNHIRGKRTNGESLIPEDAPIGYLAGDDVKEVKLMMMAAAACVDFPPLSSGEEILISGIKSMMDTALENTTCDEALTSYGIPSLKALVSSADITTSKIFKGTDSSYKPPQNPSITISQFFKNNKGTAAVVTLDTTDLENVKTVIFLGAPFFNPETYGIPNSHYAKFQAITLIHELIHANTMGTDNYLDDNHFESSENLTKMLLKACYKDDYDNNKFGTYKN